MEGGEKMNIGTLSFINAAPVGGKVGQVDQAKGSKQSFQALLNSQNVDQAIDENSDNQNVQLNNILELLKTGVKVNGNPFDLLNETIISKDMVSDLLGLTEDEWKKKLSSLVDELHALLGNNPLQATQLLSIEKSINDGKLLQGTAEILTILSKLPKESLKQMNPDLFQFTAKTATIVESLAKQMDLSKTDLKYLSILKENIQTTISKLEQIVSKDSNDNRKVILQNAFNRILVEKQERVMEPSAIGGKEVVEQPITGQVHLQQVSKVEQLVLHLNKDSKTVDYQQFVKDFTNLLGKSQFIKGVGTNKLLIKLYPEHLGSLRIEILQGKGSLTARMIATSGAAKEILDSQIHQLKQAFTQQNIQVDKIDVIYGETEAQRFDREQPGQQSFKHEQSQEFENNDEETTIQFSDILNDRLLEERI